MFGPNHILVTSRWDDGRSPCHEKCMSVVFKWIQIISGSVKTKKSCEMFEMEFRFLKMVKSIVIRCLQANKTVGCLEYNVRFA